MWLEVARVTPVSSGWCQKAGQHAPANDSCRTKLQAPHSIDKAKRVAYRLSDKFSLQ